MVTATSATTPVVGVGVLRESMAERRGTGALVLDLGVPRDVNPAAAALPGLVLLDVNAVTAGAAERERLGVSDADRQALVAAAEWEAWLAGSAAGPAITQMRTLEEERLRRAVGRMPAAERERAWREGRRALGARLHARTLALRSGVSPA